jgi:hypothetical protein
MAGVDDADAVRKRFSKGRSLLAGDKKDRDANYRDNACATVPGGGDYRSAKSWLNRAGSDVDKRTESSPP